MFVYSACLNAPLPPLVPGIDYADVALWAFTLFFFGLVFYLQQESRREGYPLESDETGKVEPSGILWFPTPKTFRLPHGQPDVSVPHGPRDMRKHPLARTAPWPGAPYEPTGTNPMADGVGPGSFAERFDVPDVTHAGEPRIAPYRVSPGYEVAKQDADPRGMTVVGADGVPGGIVRDLWVDRSEAIIRYLEVDTGTADEPNHVLVPMPFAVVRGKKRVVQVDAILGDQFAGVPKTKLPDQVTRLEEDQICAYYGGGKLYATPRRLKPLA